MCVPIGIGHRLTVSAPEDHRALNVQLLMDGSIQTLAQGCTIYDTGNADRRAFIAMEFLYGMTMKHRIDGLQWNPGEILSPAIEIAGRSDLELGAACVEREWALFGKFRLMVRICMPCYLPAGSRLRKNVAASGALAKLCGLSHYPAPCRRIQLLRALPARNKVARTQVGLEHQLRVFGELLNDSNSETLRPSIESAICASPTSAHSGTLKS